MELSGDIENSNNETLGEVAIGNTGDSIATKKRDPQRMHHFFTYNNYKLEDLEMMESYFRQICIKFCFQEEIGEETGTPHIQGVISLKVRMRKSEFGLSKKIHWERVKNLTEAYLYCCKTSTRKVGTFPRVLNYNIPVELKLITPDRHYQKMIIHIIESVPDERTVFWFYDRLGNTGKTQFTKYLLTKYKIVYLSKGKYSDICHLMMNEDMNIKNAVIIDLPRNNGNKVSYDAIEAIKGGMICSTKYEGGFKIFNSPHVIIFSNELPETNKLSEDRWRVFDINRDYIATAI